MPGPPFRGHEGQGDGESPKWEVGTGPEFAWAPPGRIRYIEPPEAPRGAILRPASRGGVHSSHCFAMPSPFSLHAFTSFVGLSHRVRGVAVTPVWRTTPSTSSRSLYAQPCPRHGL